MKYPLHLQKLIESLKRLPGVGSRSAERFAFHMLGWKEEHLGELANVIRHIPEKLRACGSCGCLVGEEECLFCRPARENSATICVIASPKDAYAIEQTNEYRGLYHVIGGLLSPLDGRGPSHVNMPALVQRVRGLGVREVIIALDSTLEGDATSLFIKQELENLDVRVSRLAFGLPMGSSLDYVDGGTLSRAFSGRGEF